MSGKRYTHNDYTVGWICPLKVEQIAAIQMLDEIHPRLPQSPVDTNAYTLGNIQEHNVVIAGLPITGNCSTAAVVGHMKTTFPRLRFGLLVGIGGGVPTSTDAGQIKLGHVVVSSPNDQDSGAIQYDHGKAETGYLHRTGFLPAPPHVLLNAARLLEVNIAISKTDPLQPHLKRIDTTIKGLKQYKFPGRDKDHLYQANYTHSNRRLSCQECGCDASKRVDISKTNKEHGQDDPDAEEQWITIHRGTIGSGEVVMRNGELRDKLAEEHKLLCFEMEAAGALIDFPCLVIRGISDYSDSHKNDEWQAYASAAAAAYARGLFYYMPLEEVAQCQISEVAINEMIEHTQQIADDAVLATLPQAQNASFDAFHALSEDEQIDFKCLEGTREGILQQIQTWLVNPLGEQIFWINGAPGTGKSTISRTVASEAFSTKRLGASFFFRRNHSDRGNASRFFTTIAAQLVRSAPMTGLHIKAALKSDPSIVGKSLEEQFDSLLLKPLIACQAPLTSPLLIVIDALDECDGDYYQRKIINLLSQTRSFASIGVRILLTSRPELPIELGFKDVSIGIYTSVILQDMPIEAAKSDIFTYVQFKCRQIQRDHDELATDWPGTKTLGSLTEMAYPLFIFAATICRFIAESFSDPQEQLDYLLTNQAASFDQINNTYLPILHRLTQSQTTRRDDILSEFRIVIGSIVIAAEPLSVRTWSTLLQRRIGVITNRLKGLKSILKGTNSLDLPISLHHLSFANFLSDSTRKDEHDFWINLQQAHQLLATNCLDLLLKSCYLKQDICCIKQPGYFRKDIDPDLITARLPPELQYACRYWILHLRKGNSMSAEFEMSIYKFIRERFLFWFEAMSLLGRASEMNGMMSQLQELFSNASVPELKSAVHEAQRFVLANAYIANIAPLQLYSSCIIFAPQCSLTRGNFRLPYWVGRSPKVLEFWNSCLQVFEGHLESVESVAFSPNERLLASGGHSGTIRIWNTSSGQSQQTLEKLGNYAVLTPRSMHFSPNGEHLSAGVYSKAQWHHFAVLFSLRTGEIAERLMESPDSVSCVVFSHDGEKMAVALGKTIELRDVRSRVVQQVFHVKNSGFESPIFSDDDRFLASAVGNCQIKIWNVISGQVEHTFMGEFNEAHPLVFLPDGNLLAYSTREQGIHVCDTSPQSRPKRVQFASRVLREGRGPAAVSKDKKSMAFMSGFATIEVRCVPSWQVLHVLPGHTSLVNTLAFSHDGKLLASGSDDKTIRLWDMASTQGQEQPIEGHSRRIWAVIFSHDGTLLISVSNDCTIRMWDTRQGQLQQTFRGHLGAVNSAAISCDNQLLASVSSDATLRIWNVISGAMIRILDELTVHNSVALSFKGRLVAAGGTSSEVKIWDTRSGKLRYGYKHEGTLYSVAFSPDGKLVASGSANKTIKIYNIKVRQVQHTLHGHMDRIKTLTFSGDGQLLFSDSVDGTMKIWNASSGQLSKTIRTGGSVSRRSFHSNFPRMYSNSRACPTQSSMSKEDENINNYLGFEMQEEWLMRNGQRLLWLPPEYRGPFDQYKDLIAIGCKSGRVVFLGISAAELDRILSTSLT